MFSGRTPPDLEPNPLTSALRRRRADGRPVLDLTVSNPTRVGLRYPNRRILDALASSKSLAYEPDPKGLEAARLAVARYYGGRGVPVAADRIVLTASSSEAYSWLFKLLADPGDEILVPTPSYPLFEHLCRAEGVRPVPYRLAYEASWSIDAGVLSERLSPRSRAIVVVSPNNPTGSLLKARDAELLAEIAARSGCAIIRDEVFVDYPIAPSRGAVAPSLGTDGVLSFTLNGLSKIAGLPQLKLGWIVASGPEPAVDEALARLEFIADLFLSVGSPVQHGLEALLDATGPVRDQILDRVRRNRAWLEQTVAPAHVCSVLPTEAGWYAIVRVPRVLAEDRLVLGLLEEEGTLVHPGFFFDFDLEGIVVLSLLPSPEVFREGVGRLIGFVERAVASENRAGRPEV